jgi:hypothetical protein
MAPHSDYDDEIDFSGKKFLCGFYYMNMLCAFDVQDLRLMCSWYVDLREQYEVRLDEGLDTFVVVDGCPIVPEASKAKLVKVLCKKLSDVGKAKPDAVFMPLDEETQMTQG